MATSKSRLLFSSKVGVGFARHGEVVLLRVQLVARSLVLLVGSRHTKLVFGSELGHLRHSVEIGIVSEMTLEDDLLPERKVSRVNGNTAVFASSSSSNIGPVSLLLLHVETGGVRKEDDSNDETGQAEPVDDHKLGFTEGGTAKVSHCSSHCKPRAQSNSRINVVVNDGGKQGSEFTHSSGETVSGSSNGDGEDLSGDQESSTVGSKLLEESRKEVDGLESVNVLGGPEVVIQECRDEEEDKVGKETNVLYTLPSDKLVVDNEGGHVVSDKRDSTVEQVPVPSDDDGVVTRADDLDEDRLEQLVSVETKVVGEPPEGRGKDSAAKVAEDELERGDVVTGLVDSSVLLGSHQSSGRVLELVVTVVGQPESGESHDTELNSEDPLGRNLAVGRVAAAMVEAQQEDDQDGLVEELTPSLHEEGQDDVSASVEFVVTAVDRLATSLGLVFERSSRGHGVSINSKSQSVTVFSHATPAPWHGSLNTSKLTLHRHRHRK